MQAAHDQLETRVAERTAELAQANAGQEWLQEFIAGSVTHKTTLRVVLSNGRTHRTQITFKTQLVIYGVLVQRGCCAAL